MHQPAPDGISDGYVMNSEPPRRFPEPVTGLVRTENTAVHEKSALLAGDGGLLRPISHMGAILVSKTLINGQIHQTWL